MIFRKVTFVYKPVELLSGFLSHACTRPTRLLPSKILLSVFDIGNKSMLGRK